MNRLSLSRPRHSLPGRPFHLKAFANRVLAHGAFTLIELLVVIAIIGLLAAILFPVFGRVREKARQSQCASNLRQLGLAFYQYAQDNDEKFPSSWSYGRGWGGKIYPYARSRNVFRCPNDNRAAATNTTPVSYVANTRIANYNGQIYNPVLMRDGFPTGFPLAVLQQPAVTVHLYEGHKNAFNISTSNLEVPEEEKTGGNTTWTGAGGKPAMPGCTSTDGGFNLDVARHDADTGFTQYLFADGHVKGLYLSSVSDPCTQSVVSVANLGTSRFAVTFSYN